MEDLLTRFVDDLVGRLTGPMQFRLVLQPLMTLIFAARAGFRDARSGRAPFFWAMFTSGTNRLDLLREGWKDVGRIFLLAIVIDVVYQLITVRWVYPLESVVVGVVLAFIPYLLSRGAFTRLGRRMGMGPARS